MIDAILQVARNAAVVFVSMGAAFTVHVERQRTYWRWVVLAAAIPAAYLIVWGFLSYGFIVFTCFAGFWLAVLTKRRPRALTFALWGGGFTYVLLSLFEAWISFRTQLRAVLWNNDATFAERLDAIGNAFSHTELLTPSNFTSLDWLNTRLNQYLFVGKAIEFHEAMPSLWLNGQSIYLAFLAWVPRFLWPGKPTMGGNSFVAEHTGMHFSDAAAIGSGPVFEFYVNFGYLGVFFGLIALGIIVRWIDRSAALALKEGRLFDCARWFTVGLAFISPLATFFFMVNTALISWIILTGLKALLDRPVTAGYSRPMPSRIRQ